MISKIYIVQAICLTLQKNDQVTRHTKFVDTTADAFQALTRLFTLTFLPLNASHADGRCWLVLFAFRLSFSSSAGNARSICEHQKKLLLISLFFSLNLDRNVVQIISRYCFNYKTNIATCIVTQQTPIFIFPFPPPYVKHCKRRWNSKQRRLKERKKIVNKRYPMNMCFFTEYLTFYTCTFCCSFASLFFFDLKKMKNTFKNMKGKWKKSERWVMRTIFYARRFRMVHTWWI